jgi:hypothetical protein
MTPPGFALAAPEYGGDGEQAHRGEGFAQPLVALPGHGAPMALRVHSAALHHGRSPRCYLAGDAPLAEGP